MQNISKLRFYQKLSGALVGTFILGALPFAALARSPVTVSPDTLPNPTVGVYYSQTLIANNVGGTASWWQASGLLPDGLTFNPATAVISGTPTTATTYSFQIGLQDLADGMIGYGNYTLTVNAAVPLAINASPTIATDLTQGTYYSQTLTATGGVAPYTFSYLTGWNPPGMTMASNGVFSGTPSTVGSACGGTAYTVLVQDSAAHTATRSYCLYVNAPTLTISPTSLPSGTVGTYYNQTPSISGSVAGAPYSWSVISGSLPAGLLMHPSTGQLYGTPTTVGTYNFTLQVYDAGGARGQRAYSISISAGAALSITTTSLPSGTVGAWYSRFLEASGGTAPYYWSVYSGTTPPGLAWNGVNAFQGTPTTAGTYNFTLRVLDGVGAVAYQSYSVTINSSGTLTISTSSLPSGTVNTYYSQNIYVSNYTGSYTMSLVSGSLPSSFLLTTAGVLSGNTPTAGTYSFRVGVTDSAAHWTSKDFTLVINPSSGSNPLLDNLTRIGLSVHNLIKLPNDGNPNTQADSAVYYVGIDGKRHAFPNDKVYFSWFASFSGIREISLSDMASIPLGSNVTYKPGTRMVKFTTDPKVYAVDRNGVLRWVKTGDVANAIYGSNWNTKIDDLSEAFYTNYAFGSDINSYADFNAATVQSSVTWVSDSLRM